MTAKGITLYMHIHQPWRVRDYTIFDAANRHDYFDGHDDNDRNNQKVFHKVADKSYRPMNNLLLKLLDENPDFRFSLSITGTFIDQALAWAPDLIEQYQQMVASGRVEIVAETYYHSLAFFYSQAEFEQQVTMHRDKIRELFGIEMTAFRNTELAYDNQLGQWADKAGFKAILAEGWDPVLGWRSPNYVYSPPETENIKLLLKNYKLSDDIAFRFGNKQWSEWPLDAEKFTHWLDAAFQDGSPLVNLFMDFETFGEHQWHDTGVFDFFEQLVHQWTARENCKFYTVTEAAESHQSQDVVDMPQTVTWADTDRDLTAWLGNPLQHEALRHLYDLESDVLQSGDTCLIEDWRKLQTSDHMYYMCTKWFNDGDVHAYFSPYDSPYDAFLYYMNAIRDMRFRLLQYQRRRGF